MTGSKKPAHAAADLQKEQETYYQERVPVMLIKDSSKYKDDVTVTINGKNYQIKRGVQVMVPRQVALVLERSHRQEMDAQRFVDNLVRG